MTVDPVGRDTIFTNTSSTCTISLTNVQGRIPASESLGPGVSKNWSVDHFNATDSVITDPVTFNLGGGVQITIHYNEA